MHNPRIEIVWQINTSTWSMILAYIHQKNTTILILSCFGAQIEIYKWQAYVGTWSLKLKSNKLDKYCYYKSKCSSSSNESYVTQKEHIFCIRARLTIIISLWQICLLFCMNSAALTTHLIWNLICFDISKLLTHLNI